MIEVVLDNGDSAEAETPEAAVFAARTIANEARKHTGIWGYDPEITFVVDGKTVRKTTLRALSR